MWCEGAGVGKEDFVPQKSELCVSTCLVNHGETCPELARFQSLGPKKLLSKEFKEIEHLFFPVFSYWIQAVRSQADCGDDGTETSVTTHNEE